MTATTSGGAPAGATAIPSAPSVAFAGGRGDGLRAARVLQRGCVLLDLAAQCRGVLTLHAAVDRQLDLRSQRRT